MFSSARILFDCILCKNHQILGKWSLFGPESPKSGVYSLPSQKSWVYSLPSLKSGVYRLFSTILASKTGVHPGERTHTALLWEYPPPLCDTLWIQYMVFIQLRQQNLLFKWCIMRRSHSSGNLGPQGGGRLSVGDPLRIRSDNIDTRRASSVESKSSFTKPADFSWPIC